MLECVSCDNRCTKKESNCDKCDYSCIKNEVPVIHNFVTNGGQELLRKLYKLYDFTCLTIGGLRFH